MPKTVLCAIRLLTFFADKIAKLKLSVSSRVTLAPCLTDSLHAGPLLGCVSPVTADEVLRILSTPHQSHPQLIIFLLPLKNPANQFSLN